MKATLSLLFSILHLVSSETSQSIEQSLILAGFSGSVHTAETSPEFHTLRLVENGSCNKIEPPLVIVRPESAQDVAIVVKIAR